MIASFTSPAHDAPLSDADLHGLHAYWRVAGWTPGYLSWYLRRAKRANEKGAAR